jgi:mRNA interferase RelE/StbE
MKANYNYVSYRNKEISLKGIISNPPPYNKKIVEAIDQLATNPRPVGYKKLKGSETCRIRVADYRIIYTVEDVIRLIEIQRIGHRKDVYRP